MQADEGQTQSVADHQKDIMICFLVGAFVLLVIVGTLLFVAFRAYDTDNNGGFIAALVFAGLFGLGFVICFARCLWAGVRYLIA